MPDSRRTQTDPIAAQGRLRVARAYLDVADLALAEDSPGEFANVAAGTAVLAGIAAADAICGFRLGQRHRGEDHRGATRLLEQATPDGKTLAGHLARLLGAKDTAHYGIALIGVSDARAAIRRARSLVERAAEEAER